MNESMFLSNLSAVKSYCNDIVCFYSDNDPYVKYEAEKEFADTITENQIMISGGGHLNTESNYTEFKELLDYL
jgi:predicted alpha/beta hydrolase family esterase